MSRSYVSRVGVSRVALCVVLAASLLASLLILGPSPVEAQGGADLVLQIGAGADDVEELGGVLNRGSGDLDIGDVGGASTVGLRFRNVCVSGPGEVAGAVLELVGDEDDPDPTVATITGHLTAQATAFTDADGVVGLARTSASQSWDIPAWLPGDVQQSPDLGDVIREIVGQPGWVACNDIALIIEGTGDREARSFNTNPVEAPKLTISTNPPPTPTPEPTATPEPGSGEVVVQVSVGADDAEELGGALNKGSGDLDIGDVGGPSTVGIRFRNVCVSSPAEVTGAVLELVGDEDDPDPTVASITGHLVADAPVFADATGIAGLDRTTAAVTWDIPAWVPGDVVSSPDLGDVIREIVGQPGWVSCNDIALIIDGTGDREAKSFNASPTEAPKLTISTTTVAPTPEPTATPTPEPTATPTPDPTATPNPDPTAAPGPSPTPDGSTPIDFDLELQVSSSADDTLEWANTLYPNREFTIVNPQYTSGLRFNNVCIDDPARVSDATLQIVAAFTRGANARLRITGHASGDAPPFDDNIRLSGLERTDAEVLWDTDAWTRDDTYESPDLGTIVREIVGRSDWVSCSNIVFVIEGVSGELRHVTNYDREPANAARLTISQDPAATPTPPATPTPTGASDDDLRVIAVGQALAALESYGQANLTYRVEGGGYKGAGTGWYQLENGTTYVESIMDVLIAEGHLDLANLLLDPRDTVLGSHSGFDFRIRRCGDRVAVFSKSDGLAPSVEDAAWWTNNNCRLDRADHPYFQVSGPLPLDDAREIAVAQAVAALESFGAENYTYKVTGAGSRGAGQGWYQHNNGGSYPAGIAETLTAQGHLNANNILVDPKDTVVGSHSSYDFLVYRCGTRIAVFSQSDGIAPSAEDAAWWADNNCNTYPLTRAHPYFQIARPLPLDTGRALAIGQAIAGLESYGLANNSYKVDGAGYNGRGTGYYQLQNATTYTQSVFNALVDQGHLNDPNLIDLPASGIENLRIQHCKDRVAIFSKSDTITTSSADATWWADNNCTLYAINNLNRPYFQLSEPLGDLEDPSLPTVTISETINTNGDTVATINVERGTEALSAVEVRVPITGAATPVACDSSGGAVSNLCNAPEVDTVLGAAYRTSGQLPSEFASGSFVVAEGMIVGDPEVRGAFRLDGSAIGDNPVALREVAQFAPGDLIASVDKTYNRRSFTWSWPPVDGARGYLVDVKDVDAGDGLVQQHRLFDDIDAPLDATSIEVIVTKEATAVNSCASVQAVSAAGDLLELLESCVRIAADGNVECSRDGIDVGDALFIAQYTVGIRDDDTPGYCFDERQLDMSDDGNINVGDALWAAQCSVRARECPPPYADEPLDAPPGSPTLELRRAANGADYLELWITPNGPSLGASLVKMSSIGGGQIRCPGWADLTATANRFSICEFGDADSVSVLSLNTTGWDEPFMAGTFPTTRGPGEFDVYVADYANLRAFSAARVIAARSFGEVAEMALAFELGIQPPPHPYASQRAVRAGMSVDWSWPSIRTAGAGYTLLAWDETSTGERFFSASDTGWSINRYTVDTVSTQPDVVKSCVQVSTNAWETDEYSLSGGPDVAAATSTWCIDVSPNGDANCDGVTNIDDVLVIAGVVAGDSPIGCFDADQARVDPRGGGELRISDALYLFRCLADDEWNTTCLDGYFETDESLDPPSVRVDLDVTSLHTISNRFPATGSTSHLRASYRYGVEAAQDDIKAIEVTVLKNGEIFDQFEKPTVIGTLPFTSTRSFHSSRLLGPPPFDEVCVVAVAVLASGRRSQPGEACDTLPIDAEYQPTPEITLSLDPNTDRFTYAFVGEEPAAYDVELQYEFATGERSYVVTKWSRYDVQDQINKQFSSTPLQSGYVKVACVVVSAYADVAYDQGDPQTLPSFPARACVDLDEYNPPSSPRVVTNAPTIRETAYGPGESVYIGWGFRSTGTLVAIERNGAYYGEVLASHVHGLAFQFELEGNYCATRRLIAAGNSIRPQPYNEAYSLEVSPPTCFDVTATQVTATAVELEVSENDPTKAVATWDDVEGATGYEYVISSGFGADYMESDPIYTDTPSVEIPVALGERVCVKVTALGTGSPRPVESFTTCIDRQYEVNIAQVACGTYDIRFLVSNHKDANTTLVTRLNDSEGDAVDFLPYTTIVAGTQERAFTLTAPGPGEYELEINLAAPSRRIVTIEDCDAASLVDATCFQGSLVVALFNNQGNLPKVFEVAVTQGLSPAVVATMSVDPNDTADVTVRGLSSDAFEAVVTAGSTVVDTLFGGGQLDERCALVSVATPACGATTLLTQVKNRGFEPHTFVVELLGQGAIDGVMNDGFANLEIGEDKAVQVIDVVPGPYIAVVRQSGLAIFETAVIFRACGDQTTRDDCTAVDWQGQVCQTAWNLFIEPPAAERLLAEANVGDVEPLAAIVGLPWRQPGPHAGFNGFLNDASTSDAHVALLALAAITGPEIEQLLEEEAAIQVAYLDAAAGLDVDPVPLQDLGLSISFGFDGDVRVYNGIGIMLAYWDTATVDTIHLSESTRTHRLSGSQLNRDYQAYLDDDTNLKAGAAAFVLYETGNKLLADQLLDVPLPCMSCGGAELPKSKWDRVHLWLDIAGFVPVGGEVFDFVNGVIYLARGRYFDAGLSAVGMIPFGGGAATGTRVVARNSESVVDTFIDARGRIFHRATRDGVDTVFIETAQGGLVRGLSDLAESPVGRDRLSNIRRLINNCPVGAARVFAGASLRGAAAAGPCPELSEAAARRLTGVLSYMHKDQRDVLLRAVRDAADGPAAERIALAAAFDSNLTRVLINAQEQGQTGIVGQVLSSRYLAQQVSQGTAGSASDAVAAGLKKYTDDLTSAVRKGWNADDLNPAELEALYMSTVLSPNKNPFGDTFEQLHERGYKWNTNNSTWAKPGNFPPGVVSDAKTRVNLPQPDANSGTIRSRTGTGSSSAIGDAGEEATERIAKGPGYTFARKEAPLSVTVQPKGGGAPIIVDMRADFLSFDSAGKLVPFESKASANLSKTFSSDDLTDAQALIFDAIQDGRVLDVRAIDDFALQQQINNITGDVFGGLEIHTWYVR